MGLTLCKMLCRDVLVNESFDVRPILALQKRCKSLNLVSLWQTVYNSVYCSAVEDIKVEQALASEESDRRMILNSIAGVKDLARVPSSSHPGREKKQQPLLHGPMETRNTDDDDDDDDGGGGGGDDDGDEEKEEKQEDDWWLMSMIDHKDAKVLNDKGSVSIENHEDDGNIRSYEDQYTHIHTQQWYQNPFAIFFSQPFSEVQKK